MSNKLRSHLGFANVVSVLALFFAVGGTSAYAINEWTGANIQDETLTGADVRGTNGSSTSPGVNGTITGADVSGQRGIAAAGQKEVDGSLTQYDVADESLTGADIQNKSLSGNDINASLTGGHIVDGSIVRGDLAPGAGGFSQVQVVNSDPASATQGQDMEARAVCPLGWDISGGGYDAWLSRGNDGDVSVASSRPFTRGNWMERSHWYARARNVGGIGVGTAYMIAFAICVR